MTGDITTAFPRPMLACTSPCRDVLHRAPPSHLPLASPSPPLRPHPSCNCHTGEPSRPPQLSPIHTYLAYTAATLFARCRLGVGGNEKRPGVQAPGGEAPTGSATAPANNFFGRGERFRHGPYPAPHPPPLHPHPLSCSVTPPPPRTATPPPPSQPPRRPTHPSRNRHPGRPSRHALQCSRPLCTDRKVQRSGAPSKPCCPLPADPAHA